MLRKLLWITANCAAFAPAAPGAVLARLRHPFHAQDKAQAILERRRLRAGRMITMPGTVDLLIGNTITPQGDFAQPWSLQWTPEGDSLLRGRTEYAVSFDALTSNTRPDLPRLTHASDHLGLTATSVIRDGEKLDIAIAPQATFLWRDDRGARVGTGLVARYDFSPLTNLGASIAWTGATAPSPTNPSGVWDVGFGFGRKLAAGGARSRLNLHANTVIERATGLNRLHILSEGLGVSVTENLTLGVTAQHYYSATNGAFAQQCLVSFDWNLGKPKDWFRKR